MSATSPPGSTPSPSPDHDDGEVWNYRTLLPVSVIILTTYLLFFLFLQVRWGGLSNPFVTFRMGAGNGQAIADGQWQRLFLAGWLHQNADHAIQTFGGALLLAVALQRAVGVSGVLSVFLLGSAAGFALEGWRSPAVMGYGGSGGVFALAGAGLMVALLGKRLAGPVMRGVMALLAGGFLGWEALFLWDPKASLLGHAGGVMCGLVLGLLLCVPLSTLARGWTQWSLASVLLALPFVSAGTLWPKTQPWGADEPGELSEITCEGLGHVVGIPVPPGFLDRSEQWIDDEQDRLRLRAGHSKMDPLVLSLIARVDAGVEPINAQGLKPEEGEKWRSPPREVRVQGEPFLFVDAVRAEYEKITYPRYVGRLNGMRIDVRFSLAADAGHGWRALPARIMEQLKVEPEHAQAEP